MRNTWIAGWHCLQPTPLLKTLEIAGGTVVAGTTPLRPAAQLRCFEPGAPIFARFPSNNLQFKDIQIERLDRLIDPGDVFPRTLAPLRRVAHDIFVVYSAGQKLLIPAILLIHLLWLWSPRAALKLATPGSADALIGSTSVDGVYHVDPSLLGSNRSATELRRAAWLAQCADARASWCSVHSYALRGRLNVDLPSARLSGWAWGVEMETGLLVAELHAAVLSFELPSPSALLRVGERNLPIPEEATRRPGHV